MSTEEGRTQYCARCEADTRGWPWFEPHTCGVGTTDTRQGMMPESDPMRPKKPRPGPPSLPPEVALRMLAADDRGPCPACGKDGFLGATYCGNEDSYIECRKETECDRCGRGRDEPTGCGSRWTFKILEQSVRVKSAAITAERDALRAERASLIARWREKAERMRAYLANPDTTGHFGAQFTMGLCTEGRAELEWLDAELARLTSASGPIVGEPRP